MKSNYSTTQSSNIPSICANQSCLGDLYILTCCKTYLIKIFLFWIWNMVGYSISTTTNITTNFVPSKSSTIYSTEASEIPSTSEISSTSETPSTSETISIFLII